MKTKQKTYWFKAKKYGWGWYPSSWQGALIIGSFILFALLDYYALEHASTPTEAAINFIPHVILLSVILISICYATGEAPGWRWAGKLIKQKKS